MRDLVINAFHGRAAERFSGSPTQLMIGRSRRVRCKRLLDVSLISSGADTFQHNQLPVATYFSDHYYSTNIE
jgi:hypothetical protein